MLGRGVDGEGRLNGDPDVAPRHARLRRGSNGELWVEDLGSPDGTWVNGHRIRGRHLLRPGDRVRVGATMLVVTEPLDRAYAGTTSMPAAAVSGPPVAHAGPELEVVAGSGVGRRIALAGDELLLGRTVDGDGRLGDDAEASRRHARIRRGYDGLVVEDLGSANGTFVNGERIDDCRALRGGDELRVGQTTLRVTGTREPVEDATRIASVPAPGDGHGAVAGEPAEGRLAAPVMALVHELEMIRGNEMGRRITFDGELVLGRTADREGRLEADAEVSRRHARIVPGVDSLTVEDLDSANGTWVNGRRIATRQPLRPDDELRVGNTELRLLAPPGVAEDHTRVSAIPVVEDEGDQLKVIGGAAARRLRVQPELVLGRRVQGEGSLAEDPEVSGEHARLRRDGDGGLHIEDLGSVNGTWVNGRRIGGEHDLLPGDSIRIGQTVILVTDPLGHLPEVTQPGGAPPALEEIELISGEGTGRRIALGAELTLGRAVAGPGRLVDDLEVSRRHARIRRGPDGGLTVEDLNSGNGTWLNGLRVEDSEPLGPGDRLMLGQTTFAVTDPVGRLTQANAQRPPLPTQAHEGRLGRLAAALARRRWVVLAVVAAFVAVTGMLGGDVATRLSQGVDDFDDPNAPSLLAEQRLADATGVLPSAGAIALVTAASGTVADPDLDARARKAQTRARRLDRRARTAQEQIQTPADRVEAQDLAGRAQTAGEQAAKADRRARRARSGDAQETVERAERLLERDPGIDRAVTYYETGSPAFVSNDRTQTFVAAFLKTDADQEVVAERLRDRFEQEPQTKLGGLAIAGPALSEQVEEDLRFAELLSVPLLFVFSLFVFRGVIAALLPVFVGIITVLGTFVGLRAINEVQLQSIFALNMVTGLGLGLAIDYSLFILSRYREELANSGPGVQPLKRTLETAGRTILFSAFTVSAALASLMVFPQRFLYSMGVGGVLCTLMAAAAALIALPALLAVLGPRVNALAPRRWQHAADRDARGERGGFWYRVSNGVMRRPLPVAVIASAVLIAAGLPFLRVEFTGVDASELSRSSPVRQVDDSLAQDFSENPGSPISLAIEAPADAGSRLEDYADELAELPDVTAVSRPKRLEGDIWQVDVTPELGPFEERTLDTVDRIRGDPAPFPTEASGVSAAFVDQQAKLAERLPFAGVILVATTLLILFLLTGSVILPLKSVLMNFLGLSATFGLLVLVFQDGNLEGPLAFESQGALNATQPILLFIVAFGLSTDYGIFLLGRIKELHDEGASNHDAVAVGLERTGRVVTAAAVLFSIALGAFATSEIVFIKLIGLGAVLAVLIDSSIIRALLVPALMAMLGTRNWWAPRPLRRIHERIGLREA